MGVLALLARTGLESRANGKGKVLALLALKRGQVGQHILSRYDQETEGVGPGDAKFHWANGSTLELILQEIRNQRLGSGSNLGSASSDRSGRHEG